MAFGQWPAKWSSENLLPDKLGRPPWGNQKGLGLCWNATDELTNSPAKDYNGILEGIG